MKKYLDQLSPEFIEQAAKGFRSLVPDERRVLAYLVNGISDEEISERIGAPLADVVIRRMSIETKVGITSPIQLGMTAISLLPEWCGYE